MASVTWVYQDGANMTSYLESDDMAQARFDRVKTFTAMAFVMLNRYDGTKVTWVRRNSGTVYEWDSRFDTEPGFNEDVRLAP